MDRYLFTLVEGMAVNVAEGVLLTINYALLQYSRDFTPRT